MSANKPNIEQIRKYLNGELDARAMHELERRAQEDPMLYDMIQGMESGSEEEHRGNLLSIDDLINARVEQDKKPVVPLWKYWPVAASLLIGLGIGGWRLTHQPTQTSIVVNKPRVVPADKVKVEVGPAPVAAPVKALTDAKQVAKISRPPQQTIVKPATVADMETKPDTGNALAYQSANDLFKKSEDAKASNGYLSSNVNTTFGGSPGAAQQIRVRGMASATGKEPLYVVDGVPMEKTVLDSIKPENIKHIEVLKDASATAIYGSRAANGVVVIDTKNPAHSLSEVSVIARTPQNKQTLSASQSVVEMKDFKAADSAVHINTALQGRVAGVNVSTSKAKDKSTARTITGVVTDKSGKEPLPGVSVLVPGTATGVVTGADGKFKITLPANSEMLTIAYIGYQSQQVKVKDVDNVNVALKESSRSLSEVVVVGYGTTAKEDITVEDAQPSIGWKAYHKYLNDNSLVTDGKTGVVKVTFTVSSTGAVNNIKVVKGLSDELNKRAVSLVEKGSGWKPQSDHKDREVKLRIKFHK